MSYLGHPFVIMTVINLMVASMMYLIIDYVDIDYRFSMWRRLVILILIVVVLSFASFGMGVSWIRVMYSALL